MTMRPSGRGPMATILAALVLHGIAAGHPDDPKLHDLRPRYDGTGWRAGTLDTPTSGGTLPPVFPALGVNLKAWITLPELGDDVFSANDCWGYTSVSGREYGLFGLSTGTAVYEVTDPGAPQLVAMVPGPESLWRDIKVYRTYAYAVSEGGGGIQVIDLSDIDNGNVPLVNTVEQGGPTSTHNVAIDTVSGYLYRCGGQALGLRIYDLDDPANPALVGEWHDRYSHDAQIVTYIEGPYAGKQIAFSYGGFNNGYVDPGLTILDVTDKNNIVELSHTPYENATYCHQGWLTPDRQYVLLNDELDELDGGAPTTTHVIDVSDLSRPFVAGTYSNGLAASDHNLYVRGDLAFAANYRSGMRVLDISDPLNPVELAFFDTVPEDDGVGTSGLWSTYPYFDSGTVIGTDMQRGLFIWELVEPSYLTFDFPQGLPDVVDPSGQTIQVRITADPGEVDPQTAEVVWQTQTQSGSAALTALGDDVYEAALPPLPCGAVVSYQFIAQSTAGTAFASPGSGTGATAYTSIVADQVVEYFVDDGEVDLGYTVSGDASDGQWELGVPVANGRGDPPADADGSGSCWLTDNDADDSNSDVDNGTVTLTSPPFATEDGAVITYAWWLNDLPNGQLGSGDGLFVELATDPAGEEWQLVRAYDTAEGAWRSDEVLVGEDVPASRTTRLRFSAADMHSGGVIEAAVDAIHVYEAICDDAPFGDFDADGTVGVQDLLTLLGAWGACATPCPQDGDADGVVGVHDLLALLGNWSTP